MTRNPYGFEGICLVENIDKLAGLNVTKEIPTLYQISVAVMKIIQNCDALVRGEMLWKICQEV